MTCSKLLAFTLIGFATIRPEIAPAQNLSADDFFEKAMPAVVSFAGSLDDVRIAFEKLYVSFSNEDKTRFQDAREKGVALSELAKEYRASFLSACFGS